MLQGSPQLPVSCDKVLFCVDVLHENRLPIPQSFPGLLFSLNAFALRCIFLFRQFNLALAMPHKSSREAIYQRYLKLFKCCSQPLSHGGDHINGLLENFFLEEIVSIFHHLTSRSKAAIGTVSMVEGPTTWALRTAGKGRRG